MSTRPLAIHQFHGGSGVGDAITNGLFYVRDLLQSLGFKSEIYCADVAPELVGKLHSATSFPDHPDTLLLVHFSWKVAFDKWLTGLRCCKAMIYHNITPEEFFDTEGFVRDAQLSRRQLRELLPSMQAVLTQSAYSARELTALGCNPVDVVPLLFDPGTWDQAPHDGRYFEHLQADPTFKILFVGRIVTNKCQEDLLRVVDKLRRMTSRPVKLLLVGGLGAGAAYRDRLLEVREQLRLEQCVELVGKIDDAQLRALYRACDVFLCLSEHEGFAVPIAEAMAFGLPVVAYSSSALPETVASGGLLLQDKAPERVAAILKVLLEEPELRRRLALAGRRNLTRFSRPRAITGLTRFLRERLGVDVPALPDTPNETVSQGRRWRIEGPFDSSYSLAAVNRFLAQALADLGEDVGLHSTEGPGDFTPDPSFLQENPSVAALWRRGQEPASTDIVLRNLYPPRVSGMLSPTRVLASWGWEESGLPWPWVEQFNTNLQLVTTVSRFVAKVLVDNGVRVPITVVGNGADHLDGVEPVPLASSLGSNSFRVLHVSSGFPRKGIDVLLSAWSLAFNEHDDTTLVIKTFANEHNRVKEQVEAFREKHPHAAEVVTIDEDLSPGQMAHLYRSCQALVAPSRGEGFGLPAAEAMVHGVPVIATGHGGMMEFCSRETAWLVDYHFAEADTHLRLPHSVWAEPDVEDLSRKIRTVRFASPAEIRDRTEPAKRAVREKFTWRAVAQRTQQAVASLDDVPSPAQLPRVAWITSWNVRCGIASYARWLACRIPHGRMVVLASRTNETVRPDEPFVQRCWDQGWTDDLQELYESVRRAGVTKAVIQFNFGFFAICAFGRLLDRLRSDGVDCYVVLHSTIDVCKPEIQISLAEIQGSLARACRLLVHSVGDLNRLKDLGLVENATLFPHGICSAPASDIDAARRSLGLQRRRVLATFGYLLPNKGLLQLIDAFAELRSNHPDLHLLMLNSLYPVPDSEATAAACYKALERHGLAGSVTLITEYLPEEEAQACLQAADLVIYPYQESQESASGAVRFGLASRRPVVCTPLSIFDDVKRSVHFLTGTSASDIATGISALLEDPAKAFSTVDGQSDLLAASDWQRLSDRLWSMMRAAPIRSLN